MDILDRCIVIFIWQIFGGYLYKHLLLFFQSIFLYPLNLSLERAYFFLPVPFVLLWLDHHSIFQFWPKIKYIQVLTNSTNIWTFNSAAWKPLVDPLDCISLSFLQFITGSSLGFKWRRNVVTIPANSSKM